jgi:dihydroorotase
MSAFPEREGRVFDLVIAGGRVLDPGSGLDRNTDVAFRDGKVAALADGLASGAARQVVDAAGRIVVPGLIDLHTHVYWGGTSLGVDADAIARRSATTTFVDAGSAGAGNVAGFRRHVIERSTVRILAYLNISFAGIFAFSRNVMVGECDDIRLCDPREAVAAAREHLDVVVGLKVRVGRFAGGASGVAPLDIAIDAADRLRLPVMAHIDHPPPSRREVVSRLRPNDVLTHCFRPFPNAPIDGEKNIAEEIGLARARGVVFDIGHGMGSLSFETASAMLAHGFLPDVISSDVHVLSIDGPAYDNLVTLSKFICLGVPLPAAIGMATTAPARAIGRSDLGSLRVGAAGDAAILELMDGRFTYVDALGETLVGKHRLTSHGIVVGGRWLPASP